MSIVQTRHVRAAMLAIAVLAGAAACSPPTGPPAAGAQIVVFDIDGTLTADSASNTPHRDALKAVQGYASKGYYVVYVTARWQPLQESSTRDWLRQNGFPERPLYMSPNLNVSDNDTVTYKTGVLNNLKSRGATLNHAYGDSSTDFVAYANAGVNRSTVFALRRVSAATCQPGTYVACLTDGYTSHLAYISARPSVL